MGKILDTITVLFKGDTSDLARKKKEAEDLAAEAAKNIKEIQASTTATNATLETTNKTLTQTENLTDNIGQGISAWIVAAHEASASINDAIGAERAHREQVRIEKGLASTKKGANEVEKALTGIVKQFATAALGALSIGRAVGAVKEVVSGTLDLQRAAFSLNLKPSDIDAYGRAAVAAGSSVEEFGKALEGVSSFYGGVTGAPLLRVFQQQLKAIRNAESDLAAEGLARTLGIPQPIVRAARQGAFSEENLANIKAIDSGIDEATEKVKLLSEAWSKFSTDVRGTFIDLENRFIGPLTYLLDSINAESSYAREAIAENKRNNVPFSPFAQTHAPENTTDFFKLRSANNFPLTQGPTHAANSVSVKISNINVQAPKGADPDYFARSITAELDHQISQLAQHYNGPKVG